MPAQMRIYAEEEVMHPVVKTFAHFGPLKQFPIGDYRIDLYFPRQKVARGCDEEGHKAYNSAKENAGHDFIAAQLICCFLGFDPHENTFCSYKHEPADALLLL